MTYIEWKEGKLALKEGITVTVEVKKKIKEEVESVMAECEEGVSLHNSLAYL